MAFLASTTGTQDPVILTDLGGLILPHPTVDRDLSLEVNVDDLINSQSLADAMTNGHLTVKDSEGNVLTDPALLTGVTVMVGATAGLDGAAGAVPQPLAGEQGEFLRGDGTWAIPSGGTPGAHASSHVTGGSDKIRDATAAQDGLMTLAYASKLDGIATNANNYSHPNHTGDVTSIGDGAQTIAADAVTNTKLANMAQDTIKGRASGAGTGDPTDLSKAQVLTILNVVDGANNYSHPNHTGDVTSIGDGAQTIANDAVTNAKLANVPTATFKGRVTAATGDPEDLTATQATSLLNAFTDSLKGLVPASGGGTANFLRADGTFSAPPDNGITQLTGDVTAGPGSGSQATTIANNAVTNVKAADMAANTVKANATASLADPADLAVGTNTVVGRVAGNIVAAQLATGQVANNAIDNTKTSDMTQATIKGRADGAGTGDPTDLSAAQVLTILNVESGADATPSATETVQGKIEIATQAETDTGTDDLRAVTPLKLKTTSLAGRDTDAIHDNVSGEINAVATKATPVGADVVLIEDSAASFAKKKATITALLAGVSLGNFQAAVGPGAITETSLTYVLVPGLTITPGAGTYFAMVSMTLAHNKSGQTASLALFANGTIVTGTQRTVGGQSSNLGNGASQCIVTVGAGQAIEARWLASSNSGGGTAEALGSRILTLLKIG